MKLFFFQLQKNKNREKDEQKNKQKSHKFKHIRITLFRKYNFDATFTTTIHHGGIVAVSCFLSPRLTHRNFDQFRIHHLPEVCRLSLK